jgi:membrane protein
MFEVYLTRVARYDIVYGSIGSVIALLFFVYISALILLYGAEIGASLRRVHHAGRLLPRRAAPDADA